MMSNSPIIVCACLALAAISTLEASPTESLHSQWTQFKAQYGKQYASPAEEAKRLELFAKNKLAIDQFNLEQSETAGYTLAVNHLSDRAGDELGSKQLPQLPNTGHLSESLRRILENDEPVPDSLDWRQHGRVTPVKDQGKCNSYWAFAAVGVLEGQLVPQKKANETISLSVQNIMDCGILSSHEPCQGGGVMLALYDVSQTAGVESEADYPYQAAKGKCKYDKSLAVIRNKDDDVLSPMDEETLKATVAKYGPVAATIKVDIEGKFKSYKSGVYSDDHCSESSKFWYFEFLIVGYGTDPKEGDYWIVKNSWSTAWGEEGYIRIARHKNVCGISDFVVIAQF